MAIVYTENAFTADDYIAFQKEMGYAQDPKEQVAKSLANSLCAIAASEGDRIVGMARLVGDAAMYWYIQDVWVLPEYRGRGIGTQIVKRLIRYARKNSIPKTSISVCLMAAKGKEGFYQRLGFRSRPHEYEGAGMEMEINID